MIPKGTLVIMASGDTQLRLKILDKDTPNKGFSTPLALNVLAHNNQITPNYLHWFLSLKGVREYLSKFAVGTVFLRIPRKIVEELSIPIPSQYIKKNILWKETSVYASYMILIRSFLETK